MVRHPTVSFSVRELDRLKCIQAAIDGDQKSGRAVYYLSINIIFDTRYERCLAARYTYTVVYRINEIPSRRIRAESYTQ
jgi:hypothetical protein